MDVARIFANLREWTSGLAPRQEDLLSRLMDAKDSKGFAGLDAKDVFELQRQILCSDEDVKDVERMRTAVGNLEPVVSDIFFI